MIVIIKYLLSILSSIILFEVEILLFQQVYRSYSLRHAWPGLSWGIGAFIIYLGVDAVASRMNNYDKPAETKESQPQTG